MIRNFKQKTASLIQLFRHPEIKQISDEALTYIQPDALLAIKKTVKRIEEEKIAGLFIEAGCALGGSAILIGLTKKKERNFFVYDVFDIIPPPSEKDGADVIKRYEEIKAGTSKGINNNIYYGYEKDLKEKVIQNMNRYGLGHTDDHVHLVEGLYQDTLKINEPVAFAHIDCDWYESVMTCLVQVVPHLSAGATMIIDDYYWWSGCRTATDEYFAGKKHQFLIRKVAGKLHVTKKK
ncbi:MAG: TylF/MycF/NovP-related O-methyltransferase [Chitinophagaceae bacterium]